MVHLTLMSYPIRTIFQTQGSEQGERKRHCCHSIHTVWINKPTAITRHRSTLQACTRENMHATTRARRREIWARERRARERRMGSRAGEAGEGGWARERRRNLGAGGTAAEWGALDLGWSEEHPQCWVIFVHALENRATSGSSWWPWFLLSPLNFHAKSTFLPMYHIC